MLKKIFCALVAFVMCFAAFACKKPSEQPAFDAEAAFTRLLSDVKFAEKLEDASSYAEYMFDELPEGTTVKYYAANGQVADAAIMFKLTDEAGMEKARAALDEYIRSRTHEAELYSPQEAEKLAKTVIVQKGLYLIACVSGDTETANSILNSKELKK